MTTTIHVLFNKSKLGYLFTFFILTSCEMRSINKTPIFVDEKTLEITQGLEEISPNSIGKTEKIEWANPAFGAYGSSLGDMIRAYFLVGDFATVKKFTITKKETNLEDFSKVLENSNLGYEIKLTNVQWLEDSTFILTYKTRKENTTGMEQYHGRIVNDTAKLFFDETKKNNPFAN